MDNYIHHKNFKDTIQHRKISSSHNFKHINGHIIFASFYIHIHFIESKIIIHIPSIHNTFHRYMAHNHSIITSHTKSSNSFYNTYYHKHNHHINIGINIIHLHGTHIRHCIHHFITYIIPSLFIINDIQKFLEHTSYTYKSIMDILNL